MLRCLFLKEEARNQKEKRGRVSLEKQETEVRSGCAGHFCLAGLSPSMPGGAPIYKKRNNMTRKPSCTSPSIPRCCWVDCFCLFICVGGGKGGVSIHRLSVSLLSPSCWTCYRTTAALLSLTKDLGIQAPRLQSMSSHRRDLIK